MSAGRPSRVGVVAAAGRAELADRQHRLAVLGELEDGAVVWRCCRRSRRSPAWSTWMPCSLATHGVAVGEAPALDEVAVGVELHDRRRRRAAFVARRLQRGAFLVVGERARPLQHPDMVVGIDGDARHLAQQPVVGQRLGPERIDLELRRVGGDGGRRKRDSTHQGDQRAPYATLHRFLRRSCRYAAFAGCRLLDLPAVQDVAGMVLLRDPSPRSVPGHLGGQLDHVAVGIAEVDRADELVVGDAAHLAALRLALGEHRVERVGLDLERDVQVEVVLLLELERHVGRLEEGEARAVVELEEGVQHARAGLAAGLGRPRS